MICKDQRYALLVAKKRYNEGTLSQDVLYAVAEAYRLALLAEKKAGRKVGGKSLWVPRSAHRLLCITTAAPGEVIE